MVAGGVGRRRVQGEAERNQGRDSDGNNYRRRGMEVKGGAVFPMPHCHPPCPPRQRSALYPVIVRKLPFGCFLVELSAEVPSQTQRSTRSAGSHTVPRNP